MGHFIIHRAKVIDLVATSDYHMDYGVIDTVLCTWFWESSKLH